MINQHPVPHKEAIRMLIVFMEQGNLTSSSFGVPLELEGHQLIRNRLNDLHQ
jgi:hypothetical protein